MLHTKYLSSRPLGNQWQPVFCKELISSNKFERAPPKENPCEVSSKLAELRRCCLKHLITDDGQTPITLAHL